MNQIFIDDVPNTTSLTDFHKNNKLTRSLTENDKRRYEKNPWGCLHPGERSYLPHIILSGRGIAIGRGKDAIVPKVNPINLKEFSINHPSSSEIDMCRSISEEISNLKFIEIADSRISRLHCIITHERWGSTPRVFIKDCSTNGTFVNNVKLVKGKLNLLKDGDKVSLVMSIQPMIEKHFIFSDEVEDCIPRLNNSFSDTPSGDLIDKYDYMELNVVDGALDMIKRTSDKTLNRSITNKYSTPDQCTLEDFKCLICLETLKDAVSIDPCGHNFCAICLSRHFSHYLEQGEYLFCPMRCSEPHTIKLNDTVRNIIKEKQSQMLTSKYSTDTNDGKDEYEMSELCPMNDEYLPMKVSELKFKQVEICLEKLKNDLNEINMKLECLEVISRLAWSDDSIRELIVRKSGISILLNLMEKYIHEESMQCSCCLALFSLVRGEGDVCEKNQHLIAEAGAMYAIADAMRTYREHGMVQLSTILCLIPLALENIKIQEYLSKELLNDIMLALDNHISEPDIQCKGFIIFGVMSQGDDVVHDQIRHKLINNNAHLRIAHALNFYGGENDEVLWSGLFSLALMARNDSQNSSYVCRTFYHTGILEVINSVIPKYKEAMTENELEIDETILTYADFIMLGIEEVKYQIMKERKVLLFSGFAVSALLGTVMFILLLKIRR